MPKSFILDSIQRTSSPPHPRLGFANRVQKYAPRTPVLRRQQASKNALLNTSVAETPLHFPGTGSFRQLAPLLQIVPRQMNKTDHDSIRFWGHVLKCYKEKRSSFDDGNTTRRRKLAKTGTCLLAAATNEGMSSVAVAPIVVRPRGLGNVCFKHTNIRFSWRAFA